MVWPVKTIFGENLVTRNKFMVKYFKRMCLNKVNLQFLVVKYLEKV